MRYYIKRHMLFVDLRNTIEDSSATILTWNGKPPKVVKPRDDGSAPGILEAMTDPNLVFLGHVNRTE